jgi:hypothetical protein
LSFARASAASASVMPSPATPSRNPPERRYVRAGSRVRTSTTRMHSARPGSSFARISSARSTSELSVLAVGSSAVSS